LLASASAANAAVIIYNTHLFGSNETPPNASTAVGFSQVIIDDTLNTLTVDETFQGLSLPAAAAHIHCCVAPGVIGSVAVPFVGFPAATSGIYSHAFDLTLTSTYAGGFLAAHGGTAASAEAALLAGLASGLAYANIHNANFPVGEIRGQLAAVPEPAAWALMIVGFGLAGVGLRRGRRPAVA
jgi:hypothetical protein